MSNSQVRRETVETVSYDVLENKLPKECFQALNKIQDYEDAATYEAEIYKAYFEAEAVPVLNEEEKEELFEQLGNQWVKNHFSTEQLRSFLDKPHLGKKLRKDE
jgi:hypothetical protein